MIPREQNRNNKRTLGWKNFIPENFLEINRYLTLTSYCNTIGQSNNAFSVLGFSWRENEDAIFWSFHPLADKTNNEHLPKPLFKVIRKSLLGTVKRATKTCIYFFFWHCWKRVDAARFVTHESNPCLATNQIVAGCGNLLQKCKSIFTFCNKICTCCSFYRLKANLFLGQVT